jgi:hypothetical protein
MTPDEVLERAAEVEAETRYRSRLGREMYQAGKRAAEQEMAAAWQQMARTLTGPTNAELEQRRWGPGGRAHFADPRPGDFPGRGAQPRPEREAEAG